MFAIRSVFIWIRTTFVSFGRENWRTWLQDKQDQAGSSERTLFILDLSNGEPLPSWQDIFLFANVAIFLLLIDTELVLREDLVNEKGIISLFK